MDAQVPSASNTADREIIIERIFDAPRELVWTAWTNPEHVAQWWGPDGFTTTIEKMDFRLGGVWKHVMHGPDGTDYSNSSVFREIVRPERIVYTHGGAREGEPVANFTATWLFEDLGSRTRLTMQLLFETPEDRDLVVREYGAVEGGKQTLTRLDGYLPQMVPPLVLTRLFDAPRELVWRAWTEAEQVARWWGPNGFTAPRCEWNAQPGQEIMVYMHGPAGSPYDFDMPMGGRFEEVRAPELLVFVTNAMPDESSGKPQLEVRNTVIFEEDGDKTRLTLTAVVIRNTPAVAGAIEGMKQGWSESLEKFASCVAG